VSLEIQILGNDAAAHRLLDIEAGGVEHWSGDTYIRVAPDLGEAMPGMANLTPLMISVEYLLAQRTPGELGQEHFSVEVRRTEPVRFPDSRLAGGPERFDVIRLTCGDIEFSAIVPHGQAWPHVSVHRVRPRSAELAPALQRAFLAALRDAVAPLVSESAA
jgi:hypothetical protein